jgi:hypothetical protein
MNPAIYLNADPDSGSAITVEVKIVYFLFPFLPNKIFHLDAYGTIPLPGPYTRNEGKKQFL